MNNNIFTQLKSFWISYFMETATHIISLTNILHLLLSTFWI